MSVFDRKCCPFSEGIGVRFAQELVSGFSKNMQYAHSFLKSIGEKPFDSVRAAFFEGLPIYPGASFYEKTHIQICIINPECIKGFFLLRSKN